MKKISILIAAMMVFLLSSCNLNSYAVMSGEKMNKLELGMSKAQVTSILGTGYTISEKSIENGNNIEILSYNNVYNTKEYFYFVFKNDKLERWYSKIYTAQMTNDE